MYKRQGYTARATPEGVSSATTRTVVVSSLVVLGLDFILTAFMSVSYTHLDVYKRQQLPAAQRRTGI